MTPADRQLIRAELQPVFDAIARDLKAMVPAIKTFVADKIGGGTAPLQQQIRDLEQRVQALESVKYCGTWQRDVEYKTGASVTCRDGLWIAKIDSRGMRPGESAAWQLALRRGRSDGKDHRNAAQ